MSLNIYTGNRMENLVEALASVVAKPLASPFVPETIVVQSKGMQRWLAMELAKRFGIWANGEYPFPNKLVWQLFCKTLPNIPDTSFFSPQVLNWKIMGLLPEYLQREEFAALRHYLEGDSDGLKRFQLAGKIADSFDQYTLFRPEMLLEWEEGKGGEWQEILWRVLAASGRGEHRGRLKEEFCRRIEAGAPGGSGIPERISVFGISYLPKYHMEILAATARIIEVNLFLLSPTREYWADIVSDREKARRTPEERFLLIEGNPLLASLGKLGRDFSDTVVEIGEVAVAQEDLYGEPDGASLLAGIQSDILNLLGAGEGVEKRSFNPDDRSVQIHSCHSPMREVEVLYDNLLALLERLEGLTPRDIVVMTPDIESYAPYISTVFEGRQDPLRKIPFSIADRTLTSEGEIAAVVLKLINLPGSRLTVPQLFDILEATPVSRRFDLEDAELETIRNWLVETRVRWGMDERDRERLGLPGYRDNSWQAGLDRLLLGYAMPDNGESLFNGKLPYDEMEGSSPRTLGKLVEFICRIAEFTGKMARPQTLGEWRDELRIMLGEFVAADDDSARELSAIAGVVEEIGELEGQAGFTERVELGVLRSWLSARLAQEEKGLGFMTGGITFCAMLPMRSIPFRVVALIGMNDGAFPRQSRPPGFDLIARNPRRGDRSLRDEDRYLFLESILSARDSFYLSYVGQSIRDNSEIPPSVLVSEFLDAIARGFTAGEGEKIADLLVTRHRLQAFSREYFDGGSTLFSYSEENCAALLDRRNNPWEAAEFLVTEIAPPSAEWRDVPLPKLLRFFDNPARFLLENRLGIRLEDIATPLEEREPFSVEGLDSYGLKQEILELCLNGGDVQGFLPIARCRGVLPPARHGEALFAAAAKEVNSFAGSLREKIGDSVPLAPVDIELELGGFRLTGRLDRIWPERMIRYRCARIKAKDRIRSWIEHLVLNADRAEGYPRESLLFMADGTITFGPVDNAAGILQIILALYWEGLMKPLRFFPASAMAYAHKQEWDLERARKRWAEGYNFPGEGDDPYYRLCFGQIDPFNAEFERVARTLLEPLLQHQV
ncbi:MAG: exodeoxyribonuclease V subunit gamma [Geobacteraceae bacterium]|jgi:exodeoxyribonuclease V gamma subunit